MSVKSNSPRWKWPVSTFVLGWAVAICMVWWSMTAYSFQIDAEHRPIDAWPQEADLTLAPDRPTVLLFLHPRCPCSVASLTELEQAIAATPAELRPSVLVIATVPEQYDAKWTDTKTIAQSESLPGASVLFDVGGRESQKFGAASSGHVMAFAPSGDLLYSGGVTQSRGHEGINLGRVSLTEALAGNHAEPEEAATLPVFGCRLCLPDETCPIEGSGNSVSSSVLHMSPR
ncbi:hypothetical protein LOC68_06035 [Blastopirellula sp. JC732]|uniref:RedB protein n=1 Tax=Blastopirellula sediminis TaxID=2894196 RepID=A0A9X1MKF7_9BACT|nr:hypothetical protein [Blastopirellula sediminis]MCC9609276.1 hypothetical protein [Blastopirellula sediminis]MCC9627947.1 hypothetical protein [Blastopirellula sediminis]